MKIKDIKTVLNKFGLENKDGMNNRSVYYLYVKDLDLTATGWEEENLSTDLLEKLIQKLLYEYGKSR